MMKIFDTYTAICKYAVFLAFALLLGNEAIAQQPNKSQKQQTQASLQPTEDDIPDGYKRMETDYIVVNIPKGWRFEGIYNKAYPRPYGMAVRTGVESRIGKDCFVIIVGETEDGSKLHIGSYDPQTTISHKKNKIKVGDKDVYEILETIRDINPFGGSGNSIYHNYSLEYHEGHSWICFNVADFTSDANSVEESEMIQSIKPIIFEACRSFILKQHIKPAPKQ